MFHSELCERSLLSPSAARKMDASFRSGGEVKKVMSVFKSSFPSQQSTATDVTKSVVTPTTSATVSWPAPTSKTSVTTISGFKVMASQSDPHSQLHNELHYLPSTKIRKRRVTSSVSSVIPKTSITTSTTTVGGSNTTICSTSLSSLLAVSDLHTRNRVDVVLKSPTRETISLAHLTNGLGCVSSSKVSTPSTTNSNLTKTVTFSLGNQQNLNLVRLTPVSLRSNIEGHSPSALISESEVKNLKELVLLHLELVQQQQSIIAEKDKIIAELRAESITLKTRLERMDRRLSVAKTTPNKKTKAADSQPVESNPSSTPISAPSTSKQSTKQKLKLTKQRNTVVREKLVKKSKKVIKPRPGQKKILKRKEPLKRTNIRKGSTLVHRKRHVKEKVEKVVQDDLFRVGADYYTQQVEEFEELEEETIPSCTNTQIIEVPSFRTHTYTNSYMLEGTEDLDDQAILKRHQKHESDEKKRKRWDLQRQREQQMREKLQHQLTPAHKPVASTREKQLDRVFPRAHEVQYIEICDKLPVNVFGHPLSSLTPSEFRLPWYPARSPSEKSPRGAKRSKR